MKVAVVSNFDTRLRPLMNDLHCCDWFDAMIVSAEVSMKFLKHIYKLNMYVKNEFMLDILRTMIIQIPNCDNK